MGRQIRVLFGGQHVGERAADWHVRIGLRNWGVVAGKVERQSICASGLVCVDRYGWGSRTDLWCWTLQVFEVERGRVGAQQNNNFLHKRSVASRFDIQSADP